MPRQTREGREVQNPAMLAVGRRDDVLIWREVVGSFRAIEDPRRIVRVGIPGMSDATMLVAVTITPDMVGKTIGVAAFPEFKTATGRQREKQEIWQAAVEKRGAPYRLIRSSEEMVQFVEDVKNGRCW